MTMPHTIPPGTLLGFTGTAGSGKDTCAELLRPMGFKSIAFADALRREVAEAYRIDGRMLTDRDTKEWPIDTLALGRCADFAFVRAVSGAFSNDLGTEEEAQAYSDFLSAPRSPRWVMQQWGTEYRRTQDATYWLDIVTRWVGTQRRAAMAEGRPALLCITDVRFENEARMVRALGGQVLRVHRPDLAPLAAGTAEHASEAEIRSNEVVHNDGDIQHLAAELQRVLAVVAPASMQAVSA